MCNVNVGSLALFDTALKEFLQDKKDVQRLEGSFD